MRNRYPGTCYRCNLRVEIGDGHFERFNGRWRTQHAACVIENRGTPDPERESYMLNRRLESAKESAKEIEKMTGVVEGPGK